MPLGKRSDLAEEFVLPSSTSAQSRGRTTGGSQGSGRSTSIVGAQQCPPAVLPVDYRAFALAVLAAQDEPGEPPSTPPEPIIGNIAEMATSGLEPQFCAWVQAGSPEKWDLSNMQ